MLLTMLLPEDGQSELFEELVVRYEKKIFNLIYRLVGDYDEAADLTQDTFLAAYRSLNTFQGRSNVYTWLYRIALNNCKNRFKHNDRRRLVEGNPVDGQELELVEAAGLSEAFESPHTEVERKELKKAIEEAITRLPDDYRIVVVLRDIHGLTYQEIAESTGLSLDVVKTRLARARGMLRQKLSPYFNG